MDKNVRELDGCMVVGWIDTLARGFSVMDTQAAQQ